MKLNSYTLLLFIVATLGSVSLPAQTAYQLPRSTPETEGVSSAGILHFVEAVEKSKNEMHSFIFLRHGKVIAEGWWDPYKPALRQTVYSASKTFTSTAVGFAVSENKLKLTDKVISFFPNDLPDTISTNLAALTVKDVLIMSDGMAPDPSQNIGTNFRNWVKGFLATPIVYKPGTVFLYNSMGTYMLSAIIQKATGQKLIDYLRPRLFDPLGVTGMDWEENLMSVNTGGWGLRVKTEDMAKLGQLYLQKGMWNGTQVLPASWIEEATTAKIIQHPSMAQASKDSSDWEQGYCYQIWRCRHNAYRADGAYGQYIIVFPEQDAVLAIQSETASMQNELNLVWDYLFPAIKKNKIPDDPKSLTDLKVKLRTLALIPAGGSATSLTNNKLTNKTFVLDPNEYQISSVVLDIKDSICHLIMNTGSDTYNLYFGSGNWKPGQTNKPGPLLNGTKKENYALLAPFRVAGNFFWRDDQTLVMQLRYLESPHMETFTLNMNGKALAMDIAYSLNFGARSFSLTGVQK
jgi:Beta-lactamase